MCRHSRPFELLLAYRTSHFFGIVRFTAQRRYHEVCTICGQGWDLDVKETEARLGTPAIPWSDRTGPLFVFGLLAFVLVMLVILAVFESPP